MIFFYNISRKPIQHPFYANGRATKEKNWQRHRGLKDTNSHLDLTDIYGTVHQKPTAHTFLDMHGMLSRIDHMWPIKKKKTKQNLKRLKSYGVLSEHKKIKLRSQ